MPLADSAATGDRLATLCDLRDLLAVQVEACRSMRDLAALSCRLQSVLAEIADLTPQSGLLDAIDEIAKRRASRRSSGAR